MNLAGSKVLVTGADGFIVVDLPPEEAGTFLAACRTNDMSFVPLVAPTTSDRRMGSVVATADAFIYCVSVTGTTGGKSAEVSVMAAAYALLVSLFLYRDLTWPRLLDCIVEAGMSTGVVLLVIMASSVVGWIVNTLGSALLGLVVGAVIVVVMTLTVHRKRTPSSAHLASSE